jgi:hypothetical protein
LFNLPAEKSSPSVREGMKGGFLLSIYYYPSFNHYPALVRNPCIRFTPLMQAPSVRAGWLTVYYNKLGYYRFDYDY